MADKPKKTEIDASDPSEKTSHITETPKPKIDMKLHTTKITVPADQKEHWQKQGFEEIKG